MSRHLRQYHPDIYELVKQQWNKTAPLSPKAVEVTVENINNKKAWIWKYMTKICGKNHRCNICGTIIRLSQCYYSNMKRHIKLKHTSIYEQEMRQATMSNIIKAIEIEDRNKIEAVLSSTDDESTVVYAKRKKSWIWKYMTKLVGKDYLCNICRITIKMPHGIYNNMKRHVKFKHADVYDEAMLKKDENNVRNAMGINRSDMWMYYEDLGLSRKRCKLCRLTVPKNFTKHLKCRHPAQFLQLKHLGKIRAVPKISWVRKYITKTGDKDHACEVCNAVIKMKSGSSSNMLRHFKAKHPYIYEKETNSFEYNSDDSDKTNTEIEIHEDTCNDKEDEPTEYPIIVSSKVTHNTTGSDTDEITKNNQGGDEQEEYIEEEYIVEYLVNDTSENVSLLNTL